MYDYEFVVVVVDCVVVIEIIGELGVVVDYVGWFGDGVCYWVVDVVVLIVGFGVGYVYDFFLGVVY